MNILQMVVVMSMIWMNCGYAAADAQASKYSGLCVKVVPGAGSEETSSHDDMTEAGRLRREARAQALIFEGSPVVPHVHVDNPCPTGKDMIVFARGVARSVVRTCCVLRRCCCCQCCNDACDLAQKLAPCVIEKMKR